MTSPVDDLSYGENVVNDVDYHVLNAKINLLDKDGKLQLDSDKEATRQFFLQHVNQNMVFFHDLEEKLEFLVDSGYYEEEVIEQYSLDFVKSLFKKAYAYKFRFQSFLGAYKYYSQYTLKTFDGKRYLERYEDRVAMTALYLARGDEELAEKVLHEIITGRLQPATPTFLNAGKAQRGEPVSCLRGTTPVWTKNGAVPIKDIIVGDEVLSHDGSYQKVTQLMSRKEEKGFFTLGVYGNINTLELTPEHPILTLPGIHNKNVQSVITGDGSTDSLRWVPVKDVKPSDFIAVSYPNHIEKIDHISLFELLSDHKDRKDNKTKSDNLSASTNPVKDIIPLNEDFGRLIGYYIAKGYAHYSNHFMKGLRFTFDAKETDSIEDTKNLLETIFGINVVIDVNKDNSTNVCAWSSILGELFIRFVGTGSDKKSLSDIIKNAPIDFLRGLLIGAFRGDGHQGNNSLSMMLTNPSLVEDLRIIALQIGLNPFFTTEVTASGRNAGLLTISNDTQDNIDFILQTNKDISSFTNRNPHGLSTRRIDGYALYEVRNSSFNEEEDTVYNLEVENTHTYNANGFVVHNCFLLSVEDNMESIARAIQSSLQLSKRGGGVALNLTNLRETGAPIKHIENQSSGVVPVMKLLEDSFSYANQLGARQGAGAVYLHAHHPDIMKFLDTKRENADEKIRIKTLSLGVVIPDITYQLAKNNEDMYLFSPYDVERIYKKPFSFMDITQEYHKMVDNPNIRKKKIKARQFFQRIAEIQFESGYPYILNVDTANRANNIDGTIQMSNLCVSGNTRILTDKGYKTIEELYETQESFNIVADNRAKNMDINDQGVSIVNSTKVFKTAENADTFTVKTQEGFEITATEWHKFYVLRNNVIEKIQLNELTIGDKLLIQSDEGVFGTEDNNDLAYLAGVWAADGSLNGTSAKLSIDHQSKSGKKQFINIIEEKVEKVLSKQNDVIEGQSVLHPKFTSFNNNGIMTLSSAPLKKIFSEYGVVSGNRVSIPDFVWNGTKDTQQSFINGLFSFGGNVHTSKDNVSVQLNNIHEGFLVDVQKLLLNLGIYTRIYASKSLWSLRVSTGFDADKLIEMVEWEDAVVEEYNEFLKNRSDKTFYNTDNYLATVESIELSGNEDVYDVTVEDGHSLIFNGIATGNCSEILQVSTPSTYNEDGSYQEIGRDISCNLASLNVAKAFDSEDFENTIETSVRALTAVSDMSNIGSVPSVENGNNKSHAIGLGQMNLHGFLAREHILYDSEEALDFANTYFHAIRYYTIKATNKIAKERGETFYNFEKSKYGTGEFFDTYINEDHGVIKTDKVRELMRKTSLRIPTVDDWKRLKDDVLKYGMYSAYLTAVAPNGSIAYINDATSSIHPVTSAIEGRRDSKIGKVYYPAPFLSDDTLPYYKNAYDIGPDAIIRMYAVANQYTDQGASCTLFYKDTATTRDLNRAQIKSFAAGLKTLYYIRIKSSTIDGTEVENAQDFCESCAI